MIKQLFMLCLLLLMSSITLAATNKKFTVQSHRKLLDAIRLVETGGLPNQGIGAIGDDGAALGPYQIWRPYWQDAVNYNAQLGGTYLDCAQKAYSEEVVVAYWNRYAPANASFEVLARIHNGGPKGHQKRATLQYWQKVQAKLR